MNNIKIFENKEFGEIRTIMIDGSPWFVGKDVAGALGYADPTGAVRKRTDEEDRGVAKMDTPSGTQELVIINESGLYSLILGSKLDTAKSFKHWVTAEVLPTIRQTGAYSQVACPIDAATLKGLATSGNLIRSTMKDEKAKPYEIAVVLDFLFRQSGVALPEYFIKAPEYEQMELDLFRG